MGWFKSLKKKITMKNVLSGVKASLKIMPGGNIIAEGIGQAEKAFKEASKELKKKPENKGVKSGVEDAKLDIEASKSNSKTFLLIGGAIVLLFLFMKK